MSALAWSDRVIGSVWERWVSALSRTEAGTSMALVRIGVGLAVLRTLLAVVLSGADAAVWYDAPYGGIRVLHALPWIVSALGGATPGVIGGLVAVSCVGALLVILGVGGEVLSRVITFATLHAFLAVVDVNGQAGGSYDELVTNGLWLVTLMGPTRTLSVETWWRTGRWVDDTQVMRWPRLLVAWQVVLMYGTTGWQKVSTHWVPGGGFGALYYILQQPTWQLRDHAFLAPYFWVTQVGTAVSWVWEVCSPLWLVALIASTRSARWSAVRWAWLVVGVIVHVGISWTLDVGSFSWATLALYPAFVHPWEWPARLRAR